MSYQLPANFGPYGNAGTMNFPGASSKETSMPWAAIIPAAASVVGSVIGSKSSNKATKDLSKANSEALAFQKQQDTMSRAEWDRAMRAWEVNRNALLERYGIPIPRAAVAPQAAPMQPGMVPGQPQGQPTGPGMPAPQWQGIPNAVPPGGNIAELIGRGGYTGQPNRYGLR